MLKPRLEKFYENIVCEDFILLYNFKNISGLTCFERAILNSTSNHFGSDPNSTMQSFSAWFIATGQKCVSTRARKSIALFGIRKSNLLGLKVTCRKSVLFTLLDKLLVFVLPKLVSNSVESSLFTERSSSKTLFTQKLHSVIQSDAAKAEKYDLLARDVSDTKLKIEGVNEDLTRSATQTSNAFVLLRKKDRSFFVISNKSALAFPEISQLVIFFDYLSGFALSCSVLHKNKGKAIGVRKNYNVNQIKKQLLSAFQYPLDPSLFDNVSSLIKK